MSINEELKDLFIVSQVEVKVGDAGEFKGEINKELSVTVLHADGKKCERCWNFSDTVGKNGTGKNICNRCAEILGE